MSASRSWYKRCDVKYCKNSTGNYPNVHAVPRDPVLFKKWEEAVKCTGTRLPRYGRVCDKHFDSQNIIEFGCQKKERDGTSSLNMVVTENIKMKILVNGAIPTRFDDEIAEYSKQKELNNADPDSEEIIEAERAKKLEKNSTHKKRPPRDLKPSKRISSSEVKAKLRPCVVTQQLHKRYSRKYEKNHISDKVEEDNLVIGPSLKSAEELLFEKVHTGQIEPRLPNKSWNVHNCQIPETGIVFAELATLGTDHSIPPFLKKSIFFDKDFNMKIYFFGKLFHNEEFKRPKSIKDLEELLRHVNGFKVCEGGPLLSELTESKVAHRDNYIHRWRHDNCGITLLRGQICKNCSSLRRFVSRRNPPPLHDPETDDDLLPKRIKVEMNGKSFEKTSTARRGCENLSTSDEHKEFELQKELKD